MKGCVNKMISKSLGDRTNKINKNKKIVAFRTSVLYIYIYYISYKNLLFVKYRYGLDRNTAKQTSRRQIPVDNNVCDNAANKRCPVNKFARNVFPQWPRKSYPIFYPYRVYIIAFIQKYKIIVSTYLRAKKSLKLKIKIKMKKEL